MGFSFSRANESKVLEEVRALQRCLISRGYDLGMHGADGQFGARTEAAVKQFQISVGIPPTGIVEITTWNMLAKSCATTMNIVSDDSSEISRDTLSLEPPSSIHYNYVVPDEIAILAQPSNLTCWATVLTMIKSWYDGLSYSIEACMDTIGTKYRYKFDNNQPLYESEKKQFIMDTGLVGEPPQNYTPEGILRLVENYGPIWITTQENPNQPFSLHARIVYGLDGDGTFGGSSLRIIDPAGGRAYNETFEEFMKKHEEVARLEGVPLLVQILHY